MVAATSGYAYLFKQLLALPDCNPLDHKGGVLALHMLLAQTPSPGKAHLMLKPSSERAPKVRPLLLPGWPSADCLWCCGSSVAGLLCSQSPPVLASALHGSRTRGRGRGRGRDRGMLYAAVELFALRWQQPHGGLHAHAGSKGGATGCRWRPASRTRCC